MAGIEVVFLLLRSGVPTDQKTKLQSMLSSTIVLHLLLLFGHPDNIRIFRIHNYNNHKFVIKIILT